MKNSHDKKHSFRLRAVFINLLLMGCFALLDALPAFGQNVTISPSSGHLIAGLTYTREVGFDQGWSSLWRHNQLPLTLLVSDKADLTPSGVLKDPAGNISLDKSQNLYVIDGGASVSTRMSISLPKGYRFTGYRIVLLNNINGQTINNAEHDAMSKRLYETGSTFDYEKPLAYTDVMGSTNETKKDYVIERTSQTETDMGNNLYFYFWHGSKGYYGATIKSIELYFTAEAEFQAEGVPGTPAEIITDGVNMVGSEFTTGKLDLGTIKPNTRDGKTYFSYDYRYVVDLKAQNWLYQEDAVTDDKKLPETAGSGSIQVLQNDGQLYYALGNGTYYIETPTETKDQSGKTIPLGYRITGAQINAHYGTKADGSPVPYESNTGTISYYSNYYGNVYLQTDGTWKSGNRYKTKWTLTKTGKLQSGSTYLAVEQKMGYDNYGNSYTYYTASSTTDLNEASAFSLSNGMIIWEGLILSPDEYFDQPARFYSDSKYAATWTADQLSTTNPAYTPSNFTLNLYGTSGKDNDVKVTANISNDNSDPTLSVSGLNNDAVKFTISGLKEGSKALITYNLTMEQLNPFVNTLDIVCHSKKGDVPPITQTFTSNDFQVAGGKFDFYIPAYFADENNNCWFTFENLKSKYMDATYDNGTSGNSRNFFVKSAYYNQYGDGKQYEATGDESAKYESAEDKVTTTQCGNAPFKYNNAADLEASGSAIDATTLEEYPYSEESYKKQGGTFTTNIEVRVNDPAKDCYLFTGDETRYNIAPTTAMEHRAYAFYLMQIDLQVNEYDAYCRMTKLYDATCYDDDGIKEKPMYGGVFEAYQKDHAGDEDYKIPSDKAFLSVSMMVDALKAAEQREGFSADQVLYLDYTNLYSVMVESKDSMAAMKKKLNPNCLIFFPQTTTYDEDNYVQKTPGGGFRACRNIVITDKQPFFSPYKIAVPHENYASYSRKITNKMNGKAKLATLVLPFSIELSGGKHSNSNNNCRFTLYQMASENCLYTDNDKGPTGTDFQTKAHFEIVDTSRTTPNRPYMVQVETASSDENTSFEILQYGSDVYATAPDMNADSTFTGENATGTVNGATYTFTNYGSYSGKKLPKNDGWFYFAQNKFYNSKNLSERYDSVYVYPFRAYFGYKTNGGGGGGAKDMAGFEVSFDEPTAIGFTPIISDNGLSVKGGHGSMTLTASSETRVSIASASGVLVWRATVEPNQPQTVTLPSGLYIVNGKKVIIR